MVQLDVDSEVNHVVGPLNPQPVDHREPVFVGGVPGKNCLKRTRFKSKNNNFSSFVMILRLELCVIIIYLTTLRIYIQCPFMGKSTLTIVTPPNKITPKN